jgi:hypothetical protein
LTRRWAGSNRSGFWRQGAFQHCERDEIKARVRTGELRVLLGTDAHAAKAAGQAIPAAKLSTLRVPLLGMGTGVKASRRSNALWRSGEKNFRETVRRAWEEGVRLFDCADTYGSLPHVAEALSDNPRDSYILVSKIWCHPKGGIPAEEADQVTPPSSPYSPRSRFERSNISFPEISNPASSKQRFRSLLTQGAS